MRVTVWVLFVWVLAACSPAVIEPVEPTDPDRSCASTCSEWRRLECEEGQNTDAGASCEQVCENAAAAAPSFDLTRDVGCMTASASCDAARACR